jgi:sulfur-carrier protein adenylyltransferase/sulfurtransferase
MLMTTRTLADVSQPDYSRQIALKEIGSTGQAVLEKSRVLVVGAGGLASPVLQYLAGAGVGCLGIVDADRLAASNLHRQPLYALADVGRLKVELAAAAIQRLNPRVRVESHPVRLAADNALALVRGFDLVIDCTDNFRAKFLINDAAVLAQRPAVFASVYQYEGQIQVYKPQASHACLRCLWPGGTPDGVVGNCAEAGVLGPVPGAVGALQALLAIKILLAMPGQLDGELVLFDFMNFSSVTLKARRRAACTAPLCTLITAIPPDADDLEIDFATLSAAPAQEWQLIDIRSADEVQSRPAVGLHIAMASLLAEPDQLDANGRYVLVCASGKRSFTTAGVLRERGLTVRSLAGGLQSLDADPRTGSVRPNASQ